MSEEARHRAEGGRTMAQAQLAVEQRHETGKGAARKLRSKGFVPAVLYGGDAGNVSLSLNSHDLFRIISKNPWETTLIELQVQQDGKTKTVPTLIKELQTDPVRRTVVHVDFMEVTMGHALEVHVPLEIIGESPGVKAGGVLEFLAREITVECLPSKIASHFDVDISSVEIGGTLTVADLTIGEDYKLLTDPETTILTVVAPKLHEEVEEVEEGEELAEPEVIQKGKKEEEEE
jgi:large subunit ribosomal protein L25